jgi:uncharacterized membrane protein YuzA (DUF378 family)
MKVLDVIVVILLIIGGLNWGLVGIFSFDLIAAIFGELSVIARIIYILVAISAIYQLILWKDMYKRGVPSA